MAFSFAISDTRLGGHVEHHTFMATLQEAAHHVRAHSPRPIIPSACVSPLNFERTMFRSARSRGAGRIIRAFELAITPDQRIGRAVMLELGFRGAFQLGKIRWASALPQLHTPLIERIDLPDVPWVKTLCS